jgi:hypothetical protein
LIENNKNLILFLRLMDLCGDGDGGRKLSHIIFVVFLSYSEKLLKIS